MLGPGSAPLASLKTLFASKRGKVLPLPPKLARLYRCLRRPMPRAHPHVISNFVTTLDGVVSLNVKGHASGGDISGFSVEDRMVMGLLRAIADVVIIGAGTLSADSTHVWTADATCFCGMPSPDAGAAEGWPYPPVAPGNAMQGGERHGALDSMHANRCTFFWKSLGGAAEHLPWSTKP